LSPCCCLFFTRPAHSRPLPSLPYTTLFRSVDSPYPAPCRRPESSTGARVRGYPRSAERSGQPHQGGPSGGRCPRSHDPPRQRGRSEEHTSELQSHLNLVCRLLLETKNTNPS